MFGDAIIGSLIGLGGSLGTAIVDFFKTRQANQHELEMMAKQKELTQAEHDFQLRQADMAAQTEQLKAAYTFQNTPTGTWIDAFSASVRPGITYAYFFAYLIVKMAIFWVGYSERGIAAGNMILQIWTSDDMLMFSAILSFWFGNRAMMSSGKSSGRGV